MKKIITTLLCLMMILTMASCNRQNISNKEKNKDTSTDISTDETANISNANYDSVLKIYRLIVEKFPIVNQNPRAVAYELGIKDEGEIETFINLYSSIHLFYPGIGQEDSLSPHYKLGCGYSMKDLNGDGIDDLVLLNNEYHIMAIFSYADKKPVLLDNYWDRNSCWIDAEGLIHQNGSNGADHSTIAVYKIANGGVSFDLIAEFGTNGCEWIDGIAVTKYYKLVNGKKTDIIESEYHALEEQYGKYLGSIPGAAATKEYSSLVFIPIYTEEEIAMEMYEAALKNEICVLDRDLGEIKLQDCRFPNSNLRLGECEILYKAIFDMDGDCINEYVIQSETKDHIVLRYYNGKVYSYCFESKNFFNLCTDGSYYWIDSYEIDNCTRGLNQITFDASSLHIKEVYRITQTSPHDYGDNNHKYYVDGKQITREEFMDYYDSNYTSKTIATFSPLDISCDYPISSEKAFELASDYWGFKSGNDDGAAGSIAINKIVILEKPGNDKQNYHIAWQLEVYTNHVIDVWYAQPPTSVSTYKDLIVDTFTGEIIEYSEAEIAMEMYEAAIKGEIYVFDEHLGEIKLEDCCFPSNNLRFDECEILNKAILDMDGDGINEYVIKSPDNDCIVLHYYNGKVYSYGFYISNFYNLNTDGTFYWKDSSVAGNCEVGLNKIIFAEETLTIKNIYSIKYLFAEIDAYYMDGKSVTRDEFLSYYNYNPKTRMSFSPFELTCSYHITAEQAWNLANTYWNNADGHVDGAAGTTIISKVVLLDAPGSDTNYYRFALQLEYSSHNYDGWESNPPHRIRTYKQLLVNASTGEIREYSEADYDGKG